MRSQVRGAPERDCSFVPVSVSEIRRCQLNIKGQEDFWAGVMFIAFGALAIYLSLDYPFGTGARMGPG